MTIHHRRLFLYALNLPLLTISGFQSESHGYPCVIGADTDPKQVRELRIRCIIRLTIVWPGQHLVGCQTIPIPNQQASGCGKSRQLPRGGTLLPKF